MNDLRNEEATALMMRFAERTGLSSGAPQQRYLWTDAFAVCNFIGLARASGQDSHLQLAQWLVDAVHHTLGQQRADAPRSGWLCGLGEQEGEIHPTRGGLRIGKKLPERGLDEPLDEQLEWERDGQYFHYLTKWMHALDQLSRSTGEATFNVWARELADTAYQAFTYPLPGGGPRRMYWKMSVDLSRPLVPSMGMHDPLDGHVTYAQLMATASTLPATANTPDISDEAVQLVSMIGRDNLVTADPLGLGGLLVDASRLAQLIGTGAYRDNDLLASLLAAVLGGLEYYASSGELRQPAEHRLAFRELGLAIGLQTLELIHREIETSPEHFPEESTITSLVDALLRYAPLRTEIESFWRDPAHQQAASWSEHRDINEVMLATSLAPRGFLVLGAPQ